MVGTIIETHPRACLLFANRDNEEAVQGYKSKEGGQSEIMFLWNWWTKHFNIEGDLPKPNDGALDSLVCATVAFLYHRCPETLLKLHHDAPVKIGRVPFYIFKG